MKRNSSIDPQAGAAKSKPAGITESVRCQAQEEGDLRVEGELRSLVRRLGTCTNTQQIKEVGIWMEHPLAQDDSHLELR